ncbi:MAG: Holliday junction resolvase RuvX [Bacteroidota bacterium]
MGRIVAIDYGQKRVGIAVTDPMRIIATGLTTVPSGKIFEFLKQYVNSETVDCFVVGLPKQMDATASESARFIEPFVKKLAKDFPTIQVERVDERFTSKMAFQTMVDSGLGKKDRQNKALVDTISATIILQSYLESMSYKQNNLQL